ncbi:FecR family protein [Echinicola sp. 20G]|uniref:FecR family protein n=1 Tax=Echinicola sp. 20G TaxID=2781961 RepID=UPI001910176D|nr:FecR domain-containing protein [Echinicola sp. 20G]
MEKKTLYKLINNQLSEEEKKEVHYWLSRPDSQRELKRILKNDWDQFGLEINKKDKPFLPVLLKIHDKINQRGESKSHNFIRRIWQEYRKFAAIIVFILFAGYAILYMVNNQPASIQNTSTARPLMTRSTGPGEKLTLILPDKSKIILNSISEISLPQDFGKNDRKVTLDGEAYFEIAPNKSKPFKVSSGKIETTALGTSFNIISRHDHTQVALIEGKVSVESSNDKIILNPGQDATLDSRDNGSIKIGSFDPYSLTAWKEGKITIDNKSLNDIFSTLERWYGVEISILNIDTSQRISGTFANENLESILSGLSFSMDFKFEINDKNVTIKK